MIFAQLLGTYHKGLMPSKTNTTIPFFIYMVGLTNMP